MPLLLRRMLIKTLKITGITLASVIALLFLLPAIFPGFVSKKIKNWTNQAITGELNFSKARLSFFRHFPSLTLTLYDFTLKGSAPFRQDTLVSAAELGLGVNLASIFSSKIKINEIYLTNSDIRILVNENGEANYNVYQPAPSAPAATGADTSGASLKIEKIQIEHSRLLYDDRSIPLLIAARELNYTGRGDLSKAIFDLDSRLEVDSFDLAYDGMRYIRSKKIDASLLTKINTHSLAFYFEKNDLRINRLPVRFKGRFEFLEHGYDMDFKLVSRESDLHDVFTALPPEYLKWFDSTDIRGHIEMDAYLTGQYSTEQNKMPNLGFNMKVRDGYIANKQAPVPIDNLLLNFTALLPALNSDSLSVNMDSLHFTMAKDHFDAGIHIKGLNAPFIQARADASIDLEKWQRALGLGAFTLKGQYQLHAVANGQYQQQRRERKGLRRTDTVMVITSIPSFNIQSSLQNGYFKYDSLPQGIDHIQFALNASCPDHDYTHAQLAMDNINAEALQNYIRGHLHLSAAKNFPIDAAFQSVIDLASITQFYPLNSIRLSGKTTIDIQTRGRYAPARKLFPVTNARIRLENGSIQTPYYPHPVDQIQVDAQVTDKSGSLSTLQVAVKPVSFRFEGQPFFLKADLSNFDNLRYTVVSKGVIDIGKIYQVFSRQGIDVKGFIKTNLDLNGLQSDAVAGRYDKLSNKGTLELRRINITAEYFPLPLRIQTGLFRFDQDKMWFDQFTASYGKSNFTLNGYLVNAIHYALQKNMPLTGTFTLSSPYILLDQLMVFGNTTGSGTAPAQPSASAPTGVIMVPEDMALTFTANAGAVQYNGLTLKNLTGTIGVDSGQVKLRQTGFDLIDCHVKMDGRYASLNPRKALFDYHINAQEFDVKKAYNTVPIFHNLAPAAAKAEGVVSLDYSIKGRLDANMMPVYPSLEGGGTLSVKNVKMRGFKLFSAVSKTTNRDKVNDPDVSKVNIVTHIKNNILTIDPVKLKVAGFRPKIQGEMSLDGRLNLKFRLGLPPFGIFGIPLTVTGTRDNPIVRVRRGSKDPALQETEDKEEDDEQGEGVKQ